MILLRPDCLVFETANGEHIPAPIEQVTVELLGEAVAQLDEHIVQNAAAAVLHYFKTDLGQDSVSVGEFTVALEQTLRSLGLEVKATGNAPEKAAADPVCPRLAEADLKQLAGESGEGFELIFFSRLRDEVRRQLGQSPPVLRFRGLHDCVMQLAGAKRWTGRCQGLNDQIVDYLRTCLGAETGGGDCALVVV